MQLEFVRDIIWDCLRIILMRCDWNLQRYKLELSQNFLIRCAWILAKTQLGIVLECFRRDALGVWLGNNLNVP